LKEYKTKGMKKIKKHRSILRSLVYLVIFLFFVTTILDPYTNSIEETEILIRVGSYPYEKIKLAVWGEIEDEDGDGISDDDEVDGLKLPSDYIKLNPGEYAVYSFQLEHADDYMLNLRYSCSGDSEMNFFVTAASGNRIYNKSFASTMWNTATPIPNIELDAEMVRVNISVTGAQVLLDGLMLKNHIHSYGVVLDGDDFNATNAHDNVLHDEEMIIFTDPDNPDSDFDGMLDGYEYLAARAGGWQDPLITNHRYAFLMATGSYNNLENFPAFWNTVEDVYYTLHDFYGYRHRDIDLLYWDGKTKGPDIVTGATDRGSINATLDALEHKVGKNDFVFLYMTGHGFYDGPQSGYTTEDALKSGIAIFDPENVGTKNDHITYEELDGFMEGICEKAKRIAFIVEACYSGRGIEVFPRSNLVYVASSDGSKVSFGQRDNLGLFGFHALKALEHPALANVPTYKEIVNIDLSFDRDKFMISIKELFEYVKDKITLPPTSQYPQLDGNANYVANEEREGIAGNTYL